MFQLVYNFSIIRYLFVIQFILDFDFEVFKAENLAVIFTVVIRFVIRMIIFAVVIVKYVYQEVPNFSKHSLSFFWGQ